MRNQWNSEAVLAEIVDRVLAVSRATLKRELLRNMKEFAQEVAQARDGGPMSRATFPP